MYNGWRSRDKRLKLLRDKFSCRTEHDRVTRYNGPEPKRLLMNFRNAVELRIKVSTLIGFNGLLDTVWWAIPGMRIGPTLGSPTPTVGLDTIYGRNPTSV